MTELKSTDGRLPVADQDSGSIGVGEATTMLTENLRRHGAH
ncbi:hypothetical protein [Streptomyces spiramyceticus]|nr:hypothetical protein [Streptomyces spiramyceticus]